MWLKIGIEIDTLKLYKYHVSGLYIKLDKKLTLKADSLSIPTSKSKPSFDNIPETLENIKYVLTFFDLIELKKIDFNNNSLSVMFHKDYLKVTSKDYEIIGTVHRDGKMIQANIPLLYIKEHNVTLGGKFSYDLHEDILITQGRFSFSDVKGKFAVTKDKNEIEFAVKSDTFTDLKGIINKFDLKEGIKAWIVDKVEAKEYALHSLSGKGKIDDDTFDMNVDSLKGEILFSGVKIHFKEDVKPVIANSFLLTYENGGLYFDLNKPRYRGRDLNGSKVAIVNLLDDNTTLVLDLKFDTAFDKTIQDLIKAYGLTIPVLQKSGKVKAIFHADIGLKKDYTNFIIDVDFSKGDVLIAKVPLPIVKGSLHYEDGFITLKDMMLKNKFYEGVVNGKVDLSKTKADLVFDAKKVQLGEKGETFFFLENEKLPFVLTYKKDIYVGLTKLALRLHSTTKETKLTLKDLSKIKKYLSDVIPIEQGGNAEITTKDFKTYTFKGIMKRQTCFLYEASDICKTRVAFSGVVTEDDVKFYAFDKRLSYSKKKSRITLKSLNIDLKKFLDTKSETKNTKKKSKASKGKKLLIIGKNSHLRYDEYRLITDSYDVEVKPNGDINAIGSALGDIIKFTRKKDILSVEALRIKDKVLHPLINFKGLQEGRYSLTKKGNLEKVMHGQIIVEGGVMSGFKAYNNILAFVNTLPALAVLHKPGYSNKGFTIEEGVAEYRMINRTKVVFDSIYIKGTSATIVGKGELDLKKKTIKMDLAIQVAREFGKIVGNIPLVGYILMGEDKSVTVGLKVSGSLDAPKVETTAAASILSLPLDIIKRTLQTPQHILNQK